MVVVLILLLSELIIAELAFSFINWYVIVSYLNGQDDKAKS
jgi:hypothetical protein